MKIQGLEMLSDGCSKIYHRICHLLLLTSLPEFSDNRLWCSGLGTSYVWNRHRLTVFVIGGDVGVYPVRKDLSLLALLQTSRCVSDLARLIRSGQVVLAVTASSG